MKLIEDLGMQYPTEKSKWKYRYGLYECPDCSIHFITRTQGLVSSCKPCANKKKGIKHGGKGTRLYSIYQDMKNRCYNSNVKAYKNYGAKGVTVCDEWLNDFVAFRDWSLANGYDKNMTIDKDVLCNELNIHPKIYSPEPVTWMTKSENAHAGKKKV